MSLHTTTPSKNETPHGLMGWLTDLMRRLFTSAAPAAGLGFDEGVKESTDVESDAEVIIAPGGYRIRRPRPIPSVVSIDRNSVDDILPDVRQGLNLLPPLPTVVVELMKEIQKSTSTASSVAGIAASDPSLAASLLRTVNGAAFGLTRKITSVAQAISYLGFDSVRSLVVQLQLDRMMPQRSAATALESEDLWAHSLAVSYICAVLADRVEGVDRGFVTTLGLLHDIGRLAIVSQFPDRALALRNGMSETESRQQREARAFGADHAAIGGVLGNRWQLPADLVLAIRWHHTPEHAFEENDPIALRKAIALLQIADQLAKYCFTYSDDMEIDTPSDEAFSMLGLTASLPELLDDKVRAAATQAILFADENSKRSMTNTRPFLKLHRGPAAVDIAARCVQSTEALRIEIGNTGVELIEGAEATFTFDAAMPPMPAESATGSARYTAAASPMSLGWFAKALPAQWDAFGVPAKLRGPARVALRSLLPNLLNTEPHGAQCAVDVATEWDGEKLFVAVRSDAMLFSARLPAGLEMNAAAHVLEAELANLLNLGWFDYEISTDGSTLLLRSH